MRWVQVVGAVSVMAVQCVTSGDDRPALKPLARGEFPALVRTWCLGWAFHTLQQAGPSHLHASRQPFSGPRRGIGPRGLEARGRRVPGASDAQGVGRVGASSTG